MRHAYKLDRAKPSQVVRDAPRPGMCLIGKPDRDVEIRVAMESLTLEQRTSSRITPVFLDASGRPVITVSPKFTANNAAIITVAAPTPMPVAFAFLDRSNLR